jgi:hypothetical protein
MPGKEKARQNAEPIPKSILAQDAMEFKTGHPKTQDLAPERRRLDRAQFLSLAEVESRYGMRFETLLRLKPSFPHPTIIADNSESLFSRAAILCWELEQRCKSRRSV